MEKFRHFIGREVKSKHGSGVAKIMEVDQTSVYLQFTDGSTGIVPHGVFSRWWKPSSCDKVSNVTKLTPEKREALQRRSAGTPKRKVSRIDFSEALKQVENKCEQSGCDMKKTSQYTAIKFKNKNIAELHVKRSEILLVVDHRSLPEDILKEGEIVSKDFGWVLDTRLKFEDSQNSGKINSVLEHLVAYYGKKVGG